MTYRKKLLVLAAVAVGLACAQSQADTLVSPSKVVPLRNSFTMDASSDGSAVLVRAGPGKLISYDAHLENKTAILGPVGGWSISLSGNGSLISTSSLTTIRAWSRRSGKILYTLKSADEFYHSTGFIGRTDLLATVVEVWPESIRSRENVTILDALSSDQVGQYRLPHMEDSVDFSKTGEWVAVGCWDETVWLLDCKTGSVKTLRVGRDRAPISYIKLSYDGKWLIACSDTGLCYIMSTRTLRPSTILNVKNYVWAAAFLSDDEKEAILPIGSSSIDIYGRRTGRKLLSVITSPGPPTTFAYSGATDRMYVTDGRLSVSIIDNFSKTVASVR